jgi:quinol monooxygenase YgiN
MQHQRVIIAGWETVDPSKRADVVASYQDLISRARKAPGCLDFAISADTLDPSRVNTFELWESEEHLEAWRKVSHPPKPLTESSVGDMHKHTIVRSGDPF